MKAFMKKEWIEVLRTNKLLLLIVVAIFLGILNPFTAKITPFLLENFLPSGVDFGDVKVTALDSWVQFYKNMPQFGMVFFLILFSNQMVKEYESNTMVLLLTRGLKRSYIILSKFLMAHILLSLSLVISYLITYAYTMYYWDQSELTHLFLPVILLFIFTSLLYTINLAGQVIFKATVSSIMLTLFSAIVFYLLSLIKYVSAYSPFELLSNALGIIQGEVIFIDMIKPFVTSIFLIVIILIFIIKKFDKQVL